MKQIQPLAVKKIQDGEHAGQFGLVLSLQLNNLGKPTLWSFLYSTGTNVGSPFQQEELLHYADTMQAVKKCRLFETSNWDDLARSGIALVQLEENMRFMRAMHLAPGDLITEVLSTSKLQHIITKTWSTPYQLSTHQITIEWLNEHGRRSTIECNQDFEFLTQQAVYGTICSKKPYIRKKDRVKNS